MIEKKFTLNNIYKDSYKHGEWREEVVSLLLRHAPSQEISIPNIHLQWFASEDEGRTFDPTERKLQKAREEGRVAKTPEIPSALILLISATVIFGFGSFLVANLTQMITRYFSRIENLREVGFLDNEGLNFTLMFLRILWPMLIVTLVMGVVGNVIQFGWSPSLKPITPDFSKVAFRIDKWFEKIISVQGWYSTGSSLIKIIMVSIVVFLNVYLNRNEIAGTVAQPFAQGMKLGVQLGLLIIIESAVFLLAFALIDFQFQKYLFLEQLKMSFQDVKEEFKESEGDPEVRKRIQAKMQDFISKNVGQKVSDSDVLVTNPTHFAVAMKYDQQNMIAPIVTAKGEDQIALRMRKIAKDVDVPIIENKPLARALYADLNVGDEIPEKYYGAVVLVFQEVYKMKGVTMDG